MNCRNNHDTLAGTGRKLLNKINDFAYSCLYSADMNALYDFSAQLADLLEDIEAEHEQVRVRNSFYCW